MKELTLKARVERIAEVTDFVTAALESLACPMRVQLQICVAVDELFGNIANYAYKGKEGDATVLLEASNDPRGIRITFRDRGVPYNPLEREDPDVTLSAEEREIGGLGIYLVKKTMDEMHYQYRDGYNELTIAKYF